MALFTPRLARLRSLSAATALFFGFCASAQAQTVTPIAISSATAIYTQNFDGIGATGTAYPAGWAGARFGGTGVAGEALPLLVLEPAVVSGGVYNAGPAAGATNATDRSLGSLASGSTVPVFGAVFQNQTGAAVTRVNIAARNEQWRAGNNAVNETTAFEYSLDATSLTSGTWVPVTALDLTERATADNTNSVIDGNAAANSQAISGSITLNWPAGTTMWIRWKDNNDTGNDALLTVDNFAISTGTTTLSNRNAAKASTVSLFPNPATDVVTIRTAGATKAQVTVTDLLGRTVLTGTTAANGTFDMSSLKAGSYLFIVNDGESTSTHKVSKQ